jgi:hypothetical protein
MLEIEKPMSQPEQELTHHAMLVLWGHYAQQVGLIEGLEKTPLHQKKRDHSPQTKVIEFLVASLAGLPHLKDISRSAQPLDQDQAVARAWGQPAWADYSGVSRTLSRMSMAEARQIVQVLDDVSRPFIDREINRALAQADSLMWDGDLTGRPVSNSSTTYPHVAYGYMSDGLQLGYQAAMVSMHSPTYGRLWLSTTVHAGDTVSCTQAEALALAAEAKAGVHPRRRTDQLAQRLEQVESQVPVAVERWLKAEQAWQQANQQLAETRRCIEQWQTRVAVLEAEYRARNRPERPYSHLAKARGRLDVQQRRLGRRLQAVEQAHRRVDQKLVKLQLVQQTVNGLVRRLQRFEQENAANPTPPAIRLRLDAGFGSADNIALLIEMGYDIYTKPQSHWVTDNLKQAVSDETQWVRVGDNAEMIAWSEKTLPNFPYPLDVALERFYTGSTVKHSTLLHYGKRPVASDLCAWFEDYNARQTIEAGIKEGKGIFTMHHFKVRSEAGLFLQEHFAAFAANFVRWAAHWLATQCVHLDPFQTTLSSIKAMVQVAAHTSAWIIWQPHGCLLRFTDHSIFAGLSFQTQDWAVQLPLPLFKNEVFSPP